MHEWKKEYSVNIQEFDEQHKEWIKIINRLIVVMKNGKSREVMGDILDELKSFSNTHFKKEENYLKKIGHEKYKEQKKLHNDFRNMIGEYEEKLKEKDLSLSIKLLNTIKVWIIEHVKDEDKKYSPKLTLKEN